VPLSRRSSPRCHPTVDPFQHACHAERLGFDRYWVAEHHGIPGIASAATSVAIGHVGAGETARVSIHC
jgi:alkanesulfonate monooxygenase SsuD/methylene tetrahydromethanopterin reductase-like flavin-dependent oxidoreductase (luciferase family)